MMPSADWVQVTSGEHLLAYNIIGPYAVERAKKDPSIGVIFPNDYIVSVSRTALIPKNAPNANAAKVFLDYLLSARGQKVLAASSFGSVRKDVEPSTTVPADMRAVIKPTKVDSELLTYLDPTKRVRFLKTWQSAIQGK